MKKLILIIKREYLTRVRKRSFLAITLLTPVVLYFGLMSFKKLNADPNNGFTKFYVVDDTQLFFSKIPSLGTLKPIPANRKIINGPHQANTIILDIPANFSQTQRAQLISDRSIGQPFMLAIKEQLQQNFLQQTLSKAGLENTDTRVTLKEEISSALNQNYVVLGIIGFCAAMVVYLAIFLYSAQVMRGVIEEKSSRIVEIIISSVSSFELMLGKVIGVGLVGLTQFMVWVLLGYAGVVYLGQEKVDLTALFSIHLPFSGLVLILLFLFYFIAGYFLYSALFAAIGSAVDNESESQQFIAPITSPLILTIAVAQSAILSNPGGNTAYWLSVIPFTSPIAMIARLPFGVPLQELLISMAFLIVSFLLIIWAAAKIYRVGILSHGKEVSIKELMKWVLVRN